MQATADTRARWIGGAFLMATLCALVLLASRTPGASATDTAAAADAAMICEAGAVDPNAEIAEVLQDTRIRLEQAGATDGDYVLLGNRGFNYGPAPTVHIDSFLVDPPRDYER